jgi:hypothetical protein
LHVSSVAYCAHRHWSPIGINMHCQVFRSASEQERCTFFFHWKRKRMFHVLPCAVVHMLLSSVELLRSSQLRMDAGRHIWVDDFSNMAASIRMPLTELPQHCWSMNSKLFHIRGIFHSPLLRCALPTFADPLITATGCQHLHVARLWCYQGTRKLTVQEQHATLAWCCMCLQACKHTSSVKLQQSMSALTESQGSVTSRSFCS